MSASGRRGGVSGGRTFQLSQVDSPVSVMGPADTPMR